MLRFALLGLGAATLVGLLIGMGSETVLASFSALSWSLLVVLVFPFVLISVFDTLGWHYAFSRNLVPFGALFAARMAGEAVNMGTPTASIGGEVVKAWLLRPHVAMDVSVPSVIIAKTTITIAQGLFLAVGIAVAWPTMMGDSALLRGMEWLLLVEVLAVGGFVLVQLGGAFSGVAWAARRLGGADTIRALVPMDDALRRFYLSRPRRLALSIACHFIGWVLSALETYIILRLLGVPLSLVTAVVIEAFSTAVRFATFLVPASLGVLEGGHVAAFVALGLGASAGLSFSLVRRVREATWLIAGLVAFAVMRSVRPVVPAVSPGG